MNYRRLKASMAGLIGVMVWFSVIPQPAHGQLIAIWGWRNLVAPQIGGPWIAPDVRFRPLGLLDDDRYWQSDVLIDRQSLIVVTVPEDGARVWIQGQLMRETGKERVFMTPPLQSGFNYAYEIRARWGSDPQIMDQTRTVPIRPGERVVVDFARPATKIMPPAVP